MCVRLRGGGWILHFRMRGFPYLAAEVGLARNFRGVQSAAEGGGVGENSRQLRWDFSLLASRSVSRPSLFYTSLTPDL